MLITDYLHFAGFEGNVETSRLNGGGRHQVYHVIDSGGREGVVKVFEKSIAGSGRRDAFQHELQVHKFIEEHLPADVPHVIAANKEHRIIVFEKIDGVKPERRPTGADVGQMSDFIIRLNSPGTLKAAKNVLPKASDAGECFAEHYACVCKRIDGLLALEVKNDSIKRMQELVLTKIAPGLDALKTESDNEIIEASLSPSDFGFHNVLIRSDKRYCFIDFEHAGLDDPAKLAADFVLQPERVLTSEMREIFLVKLDESGLFGSSFLERVQKLMPVQKAKWVTIMLNVFHREHESTDFLEARIKKAESYWSQAN